MNDKRDFMGIDIEKVWFKRMMEQISIDPREFQSIYIVYYEGVEIGRTLDPKQWKKDARQGTKDD